MAMTASTPGLETISTAQQRADEEDRFWSEHYDEFLARYPQQFVAVLDGEVVGNDSDLLALHEILTKKGLERHKVWVRFITADPRQTMH